MVTRKSLWQVRVFTFISMIVLVSCFSVYPVKSYELLLGTAAKGSFSHFAGKRLCHSINRESIGISCRATVMDSAADILTNVQSGSLDLALVNSKIIFDAFSGSGHFEFMDINYDDLRLLLPFYREPVVLLTRNDSGIRSLHDLEGKRVNGGSPFTMKSLVFQEIMAAMGWTKRNFSLYQTLSSYHAQDFLAFGSGSVQTMIHIGMHPDWKIGRELSSKRGKIVAVDGPAISRLVDSKSGFCLCAIKGGVYKDYERDIKTLAVETLLITSADIDDETVALVLEKIYSGKKNLQKTHPSLLKTRVDIETLNDSYLHPHPAATLFFQQYLNRL